MARVSSQMLPIAFVILIVLLNNCQSFTHHPPREMVVDEGENVTLTCWSDFINITDIRDCESTSTTKLRWLRFAKCNTTAERVVKCNTAQGPFSGRTIVRFDASNQQYSLTIHRTRPEDSGAYFCRLYFSSAEVTFSSNAASLTVNPRPSQNSTCEIHPTQPMAGAPASLNCTLSNKDSANLLARLANLPDCLCQTRGQVLRDTADRKEFTCVAGPDVNSGPTSTVAQDTTCTLTPSTKSPSTKPTISIAPSSVTITEGQTAVFICHSEAMTLSTVDEYTWSLHKGDRTELMVGLLTKEEQAGHFKLGLKGQILEILQVSATDHNKSMIGCTAVMGSVTYRSSQNASLTVMSSNRGDCAGINTSNGDSTVVAVGASLGGLILAIPALVAGIVLLSKRRNSHLRPRNARPSVQELLRRERVTMSVPIAETNATYENLPQNDAHQLQPSPRSQTLAEGTAAPQGDLYAIPNRRGKDIRHFTMTLQTNKATADPGFVSLPRNLEPVSSSSAKQPGTTYA
ncbi:uncharacterized protein LOC110981497 [Acanthaster planci]|uniref:Uncharacterized protein LOC110981497 n=1 Tax=Acanthaster planci TaxID=133434 RepID=A0A8B7YQ33_ACAPL|nr:uncharacterized protein LOC110981497 [Acanthaster planci]